MMGIKPLESLPELKTLTSNQILLDSEELKHLKLQMKKLHPMLITDRMLVSVGDAYIINIIVILIGMK